MHFIVYHLLTKDNKDGRKANERFLFKINGYIICSQGGKVMNSIKMVEFLSV